MRRAAHAQRVEHAAQPEADTDGENGENERHEDGGGGGRGQAPGGEEGAGGAAMSVASHLGKRSAVVGGAADGECGGGTAGTAREREADRIERGSGGEEETQADDAHITTTSMREVAECRQRAGGSADTPIRSVLAGSSGGGGDGRRTRSATTAEKAEEGRKCHSSQHAHANAELTDA